MKFSFAVNYIQIHEAIQIGISGMSILNTQSSDMQAILPQGRTQNYENVLRETVNI